jgi:hypothetical protein
VGTARANDPDRSMTVGSLAFAHPTLLRNIERAHFPRIER